jgi:NTE family protein
MLGTLDIFAEIDAALLLSLARRATSLSIDGGRMLFEEGAPSDALYILVSGALSVSMLADDGSIIRLSELYAGDTIGEMGVLTGQPRTATVTALRDSDLLRIGGGDLLELVRISPALSLAFARLVSRRLVRSERKGSVIARPRNFALIPSLEVKEPQDLASRLARAFRGYGAAVLVDRATTSDRSPAALQAIETRHRYVIYLADPTPSEWTRQVCRQTDELIVLQDAAERSVGHPALDCDEAERPGRRRHLVLLGRRHGNVSTAKRLTQAGAHYVHHVADEADEKRLVRMLLGRAVGVAFAGGGARAFAHIGMMRALKEAGVNPEIFVGTSMGAIVAATHAAGWSHDEILEQMRQAFVRSRPLGDLMWPWVALFRGDRIRGLLHQAFGETEIEDLPYPFACVTTNLTTGKECFHRRGPLVTALRASVSIPGVFAPVLIDGHFHVDGAIVDNLPVQGLRRLALGPIVAFDIDQSPRDPGTAVTMPGMLDVLWRASTISGYATEQAYRSASDLYIKAVVDGVGLLDWRAFDRAVALGYDEARAKLDRQTEALDAIRRLCHSRADAD